MRNPVVAWPPGLRHGSAGQGRGCRADAAKSVALTLPVWPEAVPCVLLVCCSCGGGSLRTPTHGDAPAPRIPDACPHNSPAPSSNTVCSMLCHTHVPLLVGGGCLLAALPAPTCRRRPVHPPRRTLASPAHQALQPTNAVTSLTHNWPPLLGTLATPAWHANYSWATSAGNHCRIISSVPCAAPCSHAPPLQRQLASSTHNTGPRPASMPPCRTHQRCHRCALRQGPHAAGNVPSQGCSHPPAAPRCGGRALLWPPPNT